MMKTIGHHILDSSSHSAYGTLTLERTTQRIGSGVFVRRRSENRDSEHATRTIPLEFSNDRADIMGSKQEEYEQACAQCWKAIPGIPVAGWFRKTFPMLIGLSEKRILGRYLCPPCAEAFPNDEARTVFLTSTLPPKYIKLPSK